jgi:type II secretory pathway component GspD/PulD (secretin)
MTCVPVYADYPIEVIELQAATLNEVIPVVRPLVGPDGTVTGMGNNLVIKAAPERVREIRELLARIDRLPRRLLITVSNSGEDDSRASGYSGSADIKLGDGQVGINSPRRPVEDSRARVQVHKRGAFRERGAGQHIQALEGRLAWIHAGSRVPVYGGYPYGTQLQDVTSGFYVVPRISGKDVLLEIRQHDDRVGRKPGIFDIQRADTVIRARLGEWVTLGGIDKAVNNSRSGLARSQQQQAMQSQQIRVKVECIDCGAND